MNPLTLISGAVLVYAGVFAFLIWFKERYSLLGLLLAMFIVALLAFVISFFV